MFGKKNGGIPILIPGETQGLIHGVHGHSCAKPCLESPERVQDILFPKRYTLGSRARGSQMGPHGGTIKG